jgi:alpha-N-arabinofuranosidase
MRLAALPPCGDYSKKINCGGPAWKGYQRDPAQEARVVHDRPLWYAKVDENDTTIWAQFREVDPNAETVEINVRQSVFYPDQPGRNYITVRGFTMRQAATPWSGAMSEQIGLIGTHWSKGWVIEDNVISHSMNTGITLGRYDLGKFGIAMPAVSAPGFVQSCELALDHGWSKESIGGHVVRNNHISHCEKNGIHGSLGGVFSTIEGNTICDIAMRGWIGGPDVAGLKLLGSQDVIIRHNHIYRCGAVGGVWLDWMAQGTRMTGNLLHDNSKDLFMEVDHGPFLIDHNLFLSGHSVQDWSQGAAYVHNLIAGAVGGRKETRETPLFSPHSLNNMKVSNIQHKDLRFHNNLFIGSGGLSNCDKMTENLQATGNVYLAGAKPSTHESDPLIPEDFEPGMKLEEKSDGWWFEMSVNPDWRSQQRRAVVTTELLGKAKIPDAPFEQPDGTPYRLDTDYFGETRSADNPAPGPFRLTDKKQIHLKVWPKK